MSIRSTALSSVRISSKGRRRIILCVKSCPAPWVDAVVISIPKKMHAGCAVEAMDEGLHVLDALVNCCQTRGGVRIQQFSNSLPVDAFNTAQARLDTEAMLSLIFGEGVAGDKSLFYGKGGLIIQGEDRIVESVLGDGSNYAAPQE